MTGALPDTVTGENVAQRLIELISNLLFFWRQNFIDANGHQYKTKIQSFNHPQGNVNKIRVTYTEKSWHTITNFLPNSISRMVLCLGERSVPYM